jgi:hypothetical protein
MGVTHSASVFPRTRSSFSVASSRYLLYLESTVAVFKVLLGWVGFWV